MNIAIMIDGLGNGGAERVSNILAKYFSEKPGNNVFLIVSKTDRPDYEVDNNIKIIQVPFCANKIMRIKKRYDFIRTVIEKEKIEVTVSLTNTFPPYVIPLRKNGLRVIYSERNDPVNTPKKKVLRLLRSYVVNNVDCIVFQTQEAKSFFSRRVQAKGVVIPNPLKKDLPEPYKGDRDHRIVMFSRLEEQKNFYMAFDAFNEFVHDYNDYTLEIYGRGSLEIELREYVYEKLGLEGKVFFKGFSTNIHNEIRSAGMYLSSSDYEGISNSMLEAMALGIPCVCTDCPAGGARMVIDNNVNGVLVPLKDAHKMYLEMKKIAENNVYSKMLSSNAVKVRERFSEYSICREWEKILK